MIRRSKLKIRPAVRRPAASEGNKNTQQTKPGTTNSRRDATAQQNTVVVGYAKDVPSTVGSGGAGMVEAVKNLGPLQSDNSNSADRIQQKTELQPEEETTVESVERPAQSSLLECPQQAPPAGGKAPHTEASGNCSKDNSESQTSSDNGVQESNTSDDKSSTSVKPVVKSRRRKLVACPQMARKRLKVGDSPKVPEERQATSTQDKMMPSVSEPTPQLQLTLPPLHTVVEPVEDTELQETNNHEENSSDKELTNLTTVTNIPSDTDVCEPQESSRTTESSTANISVTDSPVEHNKAVDNVLDKRVEIWSPPGASVSKLPPKPRAKTTTEIHRDKAVKKMKKVLEKQEGDVKAWPEMDHNVFSMSDLIYLNPPKSESLTLGMNSQNQDSDEVVVSHPSQDTAGKSGEQLGTNDGNSAKEENEEDTSLPVPQIRIAEDGSVVIDEESIVVDTEKAPDPKIKTVYEFGRDNTINQCSFRRRAIPKPTRWTEEETNKFYKCLCIVGAEFSLMRCMFGERTADDLRRKFRRERKKNPARVDKALMQQHLSKWTDDMFLARTEETEQTGEKDAVT